MDMYHTWLYQKLFNTQWFMWTIVYLVFALNVLSPFIVWFVMNRDVIMKRFKAKKHKSNKPAESS